MMVEAWTLSHGAHNGVGAVVGLYASIDNAMFAAAQLVELHSGHWERNSENDKYTWNNFHNWIVIANVR